MKKFIKTHRKLLIGVIVVLLLIGAWGWLAGNARQQASFRRTDERAKQARILASQATKATRTSRLSGIKALIALDQSNACQGDWWNDWLQTVVPSIKTGAAHCQSQEEKIEKVIQSAKRIQAYLSDEAKVTTQIKSIGVDTTIADWQVKAQKAAQNADKALEGIRVNSDVKPVQKTAKTRIEAIITGWSSLNAASTKQDKQAYLTAEAQLKQAYIDLAAIVDVSDTQLSTILREFTAAASAL